MPTTSIPEGFKAFRSPSEDIRGPQSRPSTSGEVTAMLRRKEPSDAFPGIQAAAAAAQPGTQPEAAAVTASTNSTAMKIPRKPDSAANAPKKAFAAAPTPPPPRNAASEGRLVPAAASKAESPAELVTHNGMLIPSQRFCFSGLYEDVDYKVETLFAPPVPANTFPERVHPPRRPGPVWLNNLDEAGQREHAAQMKISKMWRGVLLRRELKRSRTYEHILNARATRIQCWWRCVKAVQLRHQLAKLKQEWIGQRGKDYVNHRLSGMTNMMTWQRKRFEHAAILLQQVIRWHLRSRLRQRMATDGRPEEEWPAELPIPVEEKEKIFFPWRRTQKTCKDLALQDPATAQALAAAAAVDGLPPDRTTLSYPPTEAEVVAVNEKMRARQLALLNPAEEIVSRAEWKQDGIRHRDLDFNASVLQRVVKRHMASRHVRGEKLLNDYMNNIYRIIARSFRIRSMKAKVAERRKKREEMIQRKKDQYTKDRVAHITEEGVWGRCLQEAAALTIQKCWFWYRFDRLNAYPGQPIKDSTHMLLSPRIGSAQSDALNLAARPANYRAGFLRHPDLFEDGIPVPPKYNLIEDHIKRERELRNAEIPSWQRK